MYFLGRHVWAPPLAQGYPGNSRRNALHPWKLCSRVSWQRCFALGNLNNTDISRRFMKKKNPRGDADSLLCYGTETIFLCHLPKHAKTDDTPLWTLRCVTQGQKNLQTLDEKLRKHFCTSKVCQPLTEDCLYSRWFSPFKANSPISQAVDNKQREFPDERPEHSLTLFKPSSKSIEKKKTRLGCKQVLNLSAGCWYLQSLGLNRGHVTCYQGA